MRAIRRGSRGQTLAEFAIAIPVFLLVLLGLLDVPATLAELSEGIVRSRLALVLVGWTLLIPMLFVPGLPGVLAMLGLTVLSALATAGLNLCVLLWGVVAAIDARGTYHAREHVRDMAPWAIMMMTLAAIAGALR